jgi:hypothetical protein
LTLSAIPTSLTQSGSSSTATSTSLSLASASIFSSKKISDKKNSALRILFAPNKRLKMKRRNVCGSRRGSRRNWNVGRRKLSRRRSRRREREGKGYAEEVEGDGTVSSGLPLDQAIELIMRSCGGKR